MTETIEISNVRFITAPYSYRKEGLLGWISATLNDFFEIQGIALRITAEGKHVLSFPARRNRNNRHFFYFRPLNNITRKEVEEQIFKALCIEKEGK